MQKEPDEIEQVPLCLFLMADGTVICKPCSSPPDVYVARRLAPAEAVEGDVTEQYGQLFGAGPGT